MAEVVPIRIHSGEQVEILDQTLLPHEERFISVQDLDALCEAIRSLRVRGAPLLGIAGACGMALSAEQTGAADDQLEQAAATIKATRPTAVELGDTVDRAVATARAAGSDGAMRRKALWHFARELLERRKAEDRAMADVGVDLLGGCRAVLTHCNTGALATGGIGTAMGVIRSAWEAGSLERCFVTETRPLLQGARLTAWELERLGVPVTLLPDTAGAALLSSGKVSALVTGADRIAANGDTANKIGTYGLALAAQRARVPFYVAAPRSTFDQSSSDGQHIPIEFRAAEEVGGWGGARWAPAGIDVFNPAFDVTPADLVTAFITEHGVLRPPFAPAIASFCEEP